MSIFTPVELEWKGATYTVAPHRVMGLIAAIEDVITLHEMAVFMQRSSLPTARMATAMAAALRYAGCRVTGDDVYELVISDPVKGGRIVAAVMRIMRLTMPERARAGFDEIIDSFDGMVTAAENEALASTHGAELGNLPSAPAKMATAAASSKRPTKRRSAKAGG